MLAIIINKANIVETIILRKLTKFMYLTYNLTYFKNKYKDTVNAIKYIKHIAIIMLIISCVVIDNYI